MSEFTECPACPGSAVHNSHFGWTTHTDGPRHHLAVLGLTPEQAEAVIQACYEARISFESAMAVLRETVSMPQAEMARRAAALRHLAAKTASMRAAESAA